MKSSIFLVLLLFPVLALAQDDPNPPMEGFNIEASDSRAIEIADLVMASMGGRQVWDQTRYLSWTLFGQDHVWDKWTGMFRWQNDSTVVLVNIHTREGQAFIHGDEVLPSEELLAIAYRNWINAGYWLMLPFKLKDSGVTLGYKGEEMMSNGEKAHVLTLQFENVGLTPGNGYDVYVSTERNLVEQWSFYARADSEEPNFIRTWEGYKSYGGIMLADTRVDVTDPSNVRTLTNLGVYSELSDSVFENPNRINLSTLGE